MANIFGLDSLEKRKKREEDKDDENGTNEYYAGGVGRAGGGSGLNVVAPPDNPDEDQGPPSVQNLFSRMVDYAYSARAQEPAVTDVVWEVRLYENGFTVGDGKFRERGVPENEEFLDQVSRGICPPELVVNGKPGAVKMINLTSTKYEKTSELFAGTGQSLGGSESNSTDSVHIVSSDASAPSVDESQSCIRIQIVYPGGRRQVVKLNHNHTLHDIAALIDSSGNVTGRYQLLSATFGPPKVLNNFNETLIKLKLNGASVTVQTV